MWRKPERGKGKPVQKTILNFGNIEDWPPERIADLISRLTRFFELSPGPGPEDLLVQEELVERRYAGAERHVFGV